MFICCFMVGGRNVYSFTKLVETLLKSGALKLTTRSSLRINPVMNIATCKEQLYHSHDG